MGKDRYFKQLDPKSYRIQGLPGQLFVGLLAAIVAAAAFDLDRGRAPEGVCVLGAAPFATPVLVMPVGAAAGVWPGAAG